MFIEISEAENMAQEHMQKTIIALNDDLAGLRSDRASSSLLDKVKVAYYGADTPLNQLANISVPEARLLVVQPFDKSIINDIDKAIMNSELSLNPNNDGNIIRINIPAMTEETRKEQVKQAKGIAENSKVAIRNIRRDINEKIKKSDDLSEDLQKRATELIQKQTDAFILKITELSSAKEKEIMEI